MMSGRFRSYCFVALVSVLSGCATVDFDYPKPESHAVADTDDTYLGKKIAGLAEQHPGEAGFYPMGDGIDALASRLLLAGRAERTIDAQYYLIKNDIVSHAFISALLAAADRGVRVRLLIDDFLAGGFDTGMAALDSHPNFELRIFNPFAYRSVRFMDGITNFSRINRRMHNKSFTVDNQVTIIGGRNIADEYFGAREDAKVRRPGRFDESALSFMRCQTRSTATGITSVHPPIEAFAKMPDDPAAELVRIRAELEKSREHVLTTKYAAAVKDKVLEYVETDSSVFIWAPYVLAVDSPDKNFKSKAESVASIKTPLRESLLSATSEVIIVSAYFVPRKAGIEALVKLQESGVNVTIITNSLASTNQATVHGGYAPSRKPLLKAGVKIYEVRADATVRGSEIVSAPDARATLHTKAFIVDRREFFIGSFNFDPRSANINTELGVIIRSPELAAATIEILLAALDEQTFEVFLNEKGKLRWRGYENGEEVILKKEPQTTWGQRFAAGFFRIIPMRAQL